MPRQKGVKDSKPRKRRSGEIKNTPKRNTRVVRLPEEIIALAKLMRKLPVNFIDKVTEFVKQHLEEKDESKTRN